MWFYSPLLLVLPLVIAGHLVGIVAARHAARAGSSRRIPPPKWIASIYAHARAPFGVRSRSFSGVYVLLPLPGFVGAFLGACWMLALVLFCATGASPFIYFQF